MISITITMKGDYFSQSKCLILEFSFKKKKKKQCGSRHFSISMVFFLQISPCFLPSLLSSIVKTKVTEIVGNYGS